MPSSGFVYVIDDDESVCRAITRFVRTAGYKAKYYTSGRYFVLDPVPNPKGIVICDLRMPDMDGIALFHHLKKSGRGSVPFVFITAVEGDPMIDKAKRLGSAVLRKPIDGDLILATLANARRLQHHEKGEQV